MVLFSGECVPTARTDLVSTGLVLEETEEDKFCHFSDVPLDTVGLIVGEI